MVKITVIFFFSFLALLKHDRVTVNVCSLYGMGGKITTKTMCLLCAPRKGFEAASKDFNPLHLDVSVVGRSFMVTGANSGIGRATAMVIAKKGMWQKLNNFYLCCILKCFVLTRYKSLVIWFSGGTVHMVCRDKDKAEQARVDIVNDSGNTVGVV